MSHHVIPDDFPASPDLGDVHTYNGSEWTFTEIGWVKTVIILNHTFPIWAARPN